MRTTAPFKRVVSLCLLAALLMTLCGCSGSARRQRMETEENASAVPAVAMESDSPLQEDETILSHLRQNRENSQWKEEERWAEDFQFYVTNTQTMEGLVSGREGPFQESVRGIFSTAQSRYHTLTGHVLTGTSDPAWSETEMDDALLDRLCSADFYAGRPLPKTGPLTSMFRQEEQPFRENSLTVILSNFVEPSFSLNSLATGIEEYFDSYRWSAACVIGFRSPFVGNMYIPDSGSTEQTTYIIHDVGKSINGQDFGEVNVPCYIVVVGPQNAVEDFQAGMAAYLERGQVEFTSSLFSNSVHDRKVIPTLNFEAIPDQKWKRADTLLSSYNVGELSQHIDGNAFFALNTATTTTSGGQTEESAVEVGKSRQIGLFSTNYNGMNEYSRYPDDYDYQLYIYDQENGSWQEADKNAMTKVHVSMERVTGEVSDTYREKKESILLAAGRTEMYLGATLDHSDPEVLPATQIYRVEVRLRLDRARFGNQADYSGLLDYSMTSAEFDQTIRLLTAGRNNDRIWTAKTYVLEDVKVALARTPNLDAFLSRLGQLENKYQDSKNVVEYVDFVFGLPDKKSGR